MDSLTTSAEVKLPISDAFDLFINKITLWWPSEYTWSKDALVELTVDPIPNGLCSEIGPNGFRCDWGTVMEITNNRRFSFKWQITASRVPEPNPDKASEVYVLFSEIGSTGTQVQLAHKKFGNHGEGYERYRDAMASASGWPYLLSSFARYAEEQWNVGTGPIR